MSELNNLGQSFARSLAAMRQHFLERKLENEHIETVHVVGAGGTLTAAYEQLRNAAEYTEEHLLIQHAIKRFYRRLILTSGEDGLKLSGEELIAELTFAGYIKNDTVSDQTVQELNTLAEEYIGAFHRLLHEKGVSATTAEHWSLDVLSVRAERLVGEEEYNEIFAQMAFDHFKKSLDFTKIFNGKTPIDIETALYVAVHKALLKSDEPMIRAALLDRYRTTPNDRVSYIHANQQIDTLLASSTLDDLLRIVDRRGAPLRIVKRMIDENSRLETLVPDEKHFISSFETQTDNEYKSISQRINRGIVKSVLFLIITKVLIGVAIEVPYDMVVHGMINWLPLAVNLAFPPIYMLLLRATLLPPSSANTARLVSEVQQIFYGQRGRDVVRRSVNKFGTGYNVAYAFFFILVLFGVAFLLWRFAEFEIVHLVIFFVFLSGASFLGFRLSRMIRELESIDSQQNGWTVLRDFIYMPFVVVGRWMSEKYSKMNVVAMVLDMLIELPLKTVLRLIRQWSAFISSKKDQL